MTNRGKLSRHLISTIKVYSMPFILKPGMLLLLLDESLTYMRVLNHVAVGVCFVGEGKNLKKISKSVSDI